MEKALNKPEDYRYERKFIISTLTKYEIEMIIKLHPAMFSEIYHERFVNNLYFDTFNMNAYFESINGLKNRTKVRIRWYGDLFGLIEKPVLEVKTKDGLIGKKEKFPLIQFSLDANFNRKNIVDMIKRSEITDFLKMYLISSDVFLFNRYKRKYFQSANGRYRITIDSELEFYQVRPLNNTFLHKSVDHVTTIVELKYHLEEDEDAKWITNCFPFRMTKSSKYVIGIERLYLW